MQDFSAKTQHCCFMEGNPTITDIVHSKSIKSQAAGVIIRLSTISNSNTGEGLKWKMENQLGNWHMGNKSQMCTIQLARFRKDQRHIEDIIRQANCKKNKCIQSLKRPMAAGAEMGPKQKST